MRKFSVVLVVLLIGLTSCGMQPTEIVQVDTPTLTATHKPSATFTSTPLPTATNSPTPSVNYKMHGVNFGPYTQPGQDPNLGTIISEEQLQDHIALISPYTNWIRTYGCIGLEKIVSIGHDYGLNVALGAWLGNDDTANQKEIDCLIETATLYQPEMVIVGNETLYREDLLPDQLLSYLEQVKNALPDIPVTTSDTDSSWNDHQEIIDGVDVILANIYPYWHGTEINQSILWLNLTYQELQDISKGKKVWVAETGWPDSGNPLNEAVPSLANAAFYFLNFVSWAKENDVPYFYFEAFDEPWKETLENPQEAHWGIWTNSGVMKENMNAVFNGESMTDNWSPTQTLTPTNTPVISVTKTPTATVLAGPPSISISLPSGQAWPDNGVVKGYARNVDPNGYKVAVYIKVDGGWWTKPLWDAPLTRISANGYWECYIITGGNDANATEIAAFLVPNGSQVPAASGGGLPNIAGAPSVRISR